MSLTNYVFNGTITAVQPLATCSKDLADTATKNGPIPVPTTLINGSTHLMYPATGLRGKLRRSSRDVIRAIAIATSGSETPFSLDEHYLHTLGGIKGGGTQDRASVAVEAQWRSKNPHLSLFGAGDAGVLGFVQGTLSIGNAISKTPAKPVVIGAGARTDDLYRDKSQLRYLSESDVEALVRQAKGGRDRSSLQADIKKLESELKVARRAGKDDVVSQLSERIAGIEKQVAEVKETTGTADVSIGMPLPGWQAIPQGTLLDQCMHLMRSNPIELGLLLKAIASAGQNPFLGAHYAAGCGLFAGEWEVFEATLSGKHSLGRISQQPFEPINIEGKALVAAVSSFDAFVSSKAWDFSIPKAA